MPLDCIPADIYSTTNIQTVKFNSSITINNQHTEKTEKIDWQTSMLTNLQVIQDDRIHIVAQDDASPIYIISDGGVHNYEGIFGVMISDGLSPIASNKGKLYSVDFFETSYRSEMYSMLAGIMSLHYLHKQYHFNTKNSQRLHLFSDNKTLVHKVNNRRKVKRTVNQH